MVSEANDETDCTSAGAGGVQAVLQAPSTDTSEKFACLATYIDNGHVSPKEIVDAVLYLASIPLRNDLVPSMCLTVQVCSSEVVPSELGAFKRPDFSARLIATPAPLYLFVDRGI